MIKIFLIITEILKFIVYLIPFVKKIRCFVCHKKADRRKNPATLHGDGWQLGAAGFWLCPKCTSFRYGDYNVKKDIYYNDARDTKKSNP